MNIHDVNFPNSGLNKLGTLALENKNSIAADLYFGTGGTVDKISRIAQELKGSVPLQIKQQYQAFDREEIEQRGIHQILLKENPSETDNAILRVYLENPVHINKFIDQFHALSQSLTIDQTRLNNNFGNILKQWQLGSPTLEQKQPVLELLTKIDRNKLLSQCILHNNLEGLKDLISTDDLEDTLGLERETMLGMAARLNRPEIAKFLITLGAEIDTHNRHLETALMSACLKGHFEIVQLLLANKARIDLTDYSGLSCFCYAQSHPTIVNLLVKAGADPDELTKKNISKEHLAVISNNLMFLQTAKDFNVRDHRNATLLDYALRYNKSEIAKYLLDHVPTIEVTPKDDSNLTPIFLSVLNGDTDVLERLCVKWPSLNPNQATVFKVTPLIQAVKQNDNKMVDFLLDHWKDLDVNADEDGDTALMHACYKNNTEGMKLLLARGADPNIPDAEGDTALMHACNKNNADIVKLLLEAGANPSIQNKKGEIPLELAYKDSDLETLKVLIAGGADINAQYKTYNNRTLLIRAVNHQNPEMVNFLLENGADPKIKDVKGMQFIHFALIKQQMGFSGFDSLIKDELKKSQISKLAEFFLDEKKLCHRFGVKTEFNASGKTYTMEGSRSEYAMKELQDSLDDFLEFKTRQKSSFLSSLFSALTKSIFWPSSLSFETFDWSAARQNISSYVNEQEDVEEAINKKTPLNIVSFKSGWSTHATSLIVIVIQKEAQEEFFVVKGNRAGGEKPGLRFYSVGNPDQLIPTLKKGLVEKENDQGQFFNETINQELNLKEIPENYIATQPQSAGTCTWTSAKMTLRGMIYWQLRGQGKSHQEAVQQSKILYKEWSAYDRKVSLERFIKKVEALEDKMRLLGIDPSQLEEEGIIPYKILGDVLLKYVKKGRIETIKKLLNQFPQLIEANNDIGNYFLVAHFYKKLNVLPYLETFDNNYRKRRRK